MPNVPASEVGVGLCGNGPAVIMCPLVVSGDIFDLSGFCGNPGVAQGPSVASISAYYQEQGMMYVFVVCREVRGIVSHWRGKGVRRSRITSKFACEDSSLN